jgi:hypothetical protein
MKTKYLAYAQACAICNDYQYLQGESLEAGHQIDYISVAPYSRILQWQFANNLLRGISSTALLDQNLTGRYDVIIISKTDCEPGFMILDLRSHLKAAGIDFDPTRYQCLRNRNIPLVTLKQLLG